MHFLNIALVLMFAQSAICASLEAEQHFDISEKQGSSGTVCLREHNSARRSDGKPNLTGDSRLVNAARKHNDVMIKQNCFDHQCPNEKSLGDRVTAERYRWSTVGENIAAEQTSCKSVMETWMGSPGHKANILNEKFKNVGCARQNCNDCKYSVYWTCVFGAQQ